MIIVLPTTTGVLVGIEPGALIKWPTGKNALPITHDDLHRFQAMQRYLGKTIQKFNERDAEN
jgi:hypothetical protein